MRKFLLTVTLLIIILLSNNTLPVLAEKGSDNGVGTRRERENRESKLEDSLVREKEASHSSLKGEKLEAAKAKVCENKQDSIIKRSQQMANRANSQLINFTNIEQRVEDFYNNRMVPKGIPVANYAGLLASIDAKKALVKADITVALKDAKNFSCQSTNPKGQLDNFKQDMRTLIKDLKTYRTSIKNLIVAVRTAFNASQEASSSAKK